MLLLRSVYISGRWMRLINFRNVLISKYKGTDVYEQRDCWKEDKGRLASEDRFQYHEWTFKQACISYLLRSLASSSTLLPFLFLPSVVPPSTMVRLECFPFRLLQFVSYCMSPKLCAILNILINWTQHMYRIDENKFCLLDEIWFVV